MSTNKLLYRVIKDYSEYFNYFNINLSVSDDVETAAMSFNGSAYTLHISESFVSRYELNYDDIYFVLAHEFAHKKGGDLFRYFANDMSDTDKIVANIVLDCFINTEIIEKRFWNKELTIFDKLYGSKQFPAILLYPPSYIDPHIDKALNIFDDQLAQIGFDNTSRNTLKAVYSDMWSKKCSIMSAYSRLRPFFPDNIKLKLIFLGESESDCQHDAVPGGLDGIDENAINRKAGRTPYRSFQWQHIYNAIQQLLSSNGMDMTITQTLQHVSTPLPAVSRRSMLFHHAGIHESLYRGKMPMQDNENVSCNIFIDVSGSFNEQYPFIIGLLRSLKGISIKNIYQFSTIVEKISFEEFKNGDVITTSGTSLTPLLRYALHEHMKSILIITDGQVRKPSERLLAMTRAAKMRIFSVIAGRKGYFHPVSDVIKDISEKTWEVTL